MDAAAWLRVFAAQRDEAYRVHEAAQAAFRAGVAAKVAAEREAVAAALLVSARPRVVVLEPGVEVDVLGEGALVPAPARRVAVGAVASGWRMRCVRSVAADPKHGAVAVVSVRWWRHDERGWATWHQNVRGGWDYECGWFAGHGGLEQVVASSISTRMKTAATAAAKAGREPVEIKLRGVLDVVEGVRLTRH